MGLELYDGRGKWLDRFSSATGVPLLAESVAKRPKRWPLYHEFLQPGKILVTAELIAPPTKIANANRSSHQPHKRSRHLTRKGLFFLQLSHNSVTQ